MITTIETIDKKPQNRTEQNTAQHKKINEKKRLFLPQKNWFSHKTIRGWGWWCCCCAIKTKHFFAKLIFYLYNIYDKVVLMVVCVCVLDTKHTGYVVFIWVTSSFLLRFLIEWKSRVCGLQITFCSWCKTTISLIRMYICGYIYLIDIFVGHDDYIEYEASALPIHTNTNILIRILIYRRR